MRENNNLFEGEGEEIKKKSPHTFIRRLASVYAPHTAHTRYATTPGAIGLIHEPHSNIFTAHTALRGTRGVN